MGLFKKLLRVAKVAAPLALAFTPLSPFAAGAIGAGLGATGGGGIKGALMGGAGGYLGAGGLTSTAAGGLGGTAIGNAATSAGNYLKSGLSNIVGTAGSYSPMLTSAGQGYTAGTGFLGSLGDVGTALSSGGSTLKNLLMGGQGTASSMGGFGGLGNAASNIYSAYSTGQTAKKIAGTQQAANKQAMSAISPYSQSGQVANTRLQSLLGLDGGSEQALATLRNSPGYQFRLEQGQQAADRANAARGGYFSGRALQESQQLGQGLADQTYTDYIHNLAQQSSQGLGAAGQMAGLYGTGGDIQANRLMTTTEARNKALAGILEPKQQINPFMAAMLARGY